MQRQVANLTKCKSLHVGAREIPAVMSREQRIVHAETVRTNLIISNCLFWECDAGWVGGAGRLVDSWPLNLNVTDTQMMNNYAPITSAFNWAIYSKSFDEGTGIHGDSHVRLENVEVTENYNAVRNRPEPNEFEDRLPVPRYSQQPMQFLAFTGHWEESKNWKLTFDIDDYYSHDIYANQQNGLTIYNVAECNCGCFHVNLRDARFENSWGSGASLWQGTAVLLWLDSVDILRSSFINNGAIDETRTSTAAGVAYLDIKFQARVHSSEFINGETASGGGISFMGTGWLEIRDCLFRGNTAWQNGGAIATKAVGANADGLTLMVLNSIFDSNSVDQDQRDAEVEIVIYLYTGSTGTGAGGTNGDMNEYLPVWKIDGNDPNEVPFPAGCQPPPYADHFARKVGNRFQPNPVKRRTSSGQYVPTCQDGSVPADETVYGNLSYPFDTFQSQVVKLTVGEHKLWHGLIANQPTQADQWYGDGYIAIVDILAPVYVRVTDNRGSPDANGVVRHMGCYAGLRNEQTAANCPKNFDRRDPQYETCNDFCRSGETFWSYTNFTIPFGVGGAINILGGQGISIQNSKFQNNVAGRGTAVGVASAESFVVKNTTYIDAGHTLQIRNPLTQSQCAEAPCDPGFSCEFSKKLRLSLSCDTCAFNEFGTDGIECSQCEAGTEPSLNHTDCVPCERGKFSTLGFCEDCPAGTTSTRGAQSCTECPTGTAYSVQSTACETCEAGKRAVDGVTCEECPVGTKSSADFAYCEECGQGQIRAPGQTACVSCPPGTVAAEDRGRCERCSEPGEFSENGLACVACPAGSRPLENRTRCAPCPSGTAGVEGMCEICDAGKSAPSNSPACQTCPAGTASMRGGECLPCAPGFQPTDVQDLCISCATISNAYSVDGTQCVQCPARMQPNDDRTKCNCMINTYNQLEVGAVYCDGLRTQESTTRLDHCASCPTCLDCTVPGYTKVQPGWALYGERNVYRCPGGVETAEAACVGARLENMSTSALTWSKSDSGEFHPAALKAQCAEAYRGPICGTYHCNSQKHPINSPSLPFQSLISVNLQETSPLFASLFVRFYSMNQNFNREQDVARMISTTSK